MRERVRRDLGIADGAHGRALRAHLARRPGLGGTGPRLALHLDLAASRARLRRTACVLLRLHYFVAGRLAAGRRPGVRDVSDHPDIAELYLAADVLVTDYSSAMFDFAVTGKPIVLFAYDIEDYRDCCAASTSTCEEIAPGPVLDDRASRSSTPWPTCRGSWPSTRSRTRASATVLLARGRPRHRARARPGPALAPVQRARGGAGVSGVQVVLLAAGLGTRLGRGHPKALTSCATAGRSCASSSTTAGGLRCRRAHRRRRRPQVRTRSWRRPRTSLRLQPDYATTNTSKSLLRALELAGPAACCG